MRCLTYIVQHFICFLDENIACSPRSSQRETLEDAVCQRMICIVNAFHELVQSAIPAGSCSEIFLKVRSLKLYSR